MKGDRAFALAIFVFLLLLTNGCLNMTPRAEVPKSVVVTITATKDCKDANCTCLVEANRPRYKWWLCEDGYGPGGVTIPQDIYNSTQGDDCVDIRSNGLPAQTCMKYNQLTGSLFRKHAVCDGPLGWGFTCGNVWYYSCANCGSSDSEGQAVCAGGAGCHYDHNDHCTEEKCPLTAGPASVTGDPEEETCRCSGYTPTMEGIPPCFGTGPGGSGCEVILNRHSSDGDLGGSCPCYSECVGGALHPMSFVCQKGSSTTNYTFGDCTLHVESSFQGGIFRNVTPCNASAMLNIVQDPLKTIPYFMIGQGALLEALNTARNYCKPTHAYGAIVRLGDSVFHPPELSITNGSTICWESPDISHGLVIDGGVFLVNSTTRLCLDNLTLVTTADKLHEVVDKFTGEKSNVTVSMKGHLYITEKSFLPRFLLYPEGPDLEVHNIDTAAHGVDGWNNQWGTGAAIVGTTIAAGGTYSAGALGVGPHLFYDATNNMSATVFVLSKETTVSVTGGGMTPSEVAINLGDEVCFTCGTAVGHILSIYKMLDPATLVFYENRTMGAMKTCCWRPPAGTYKVRDMTTGSSIQVYVADRKSEYTVELHNYQFNPQNLAVLQGTEVCFFNPSNFNREITPVVPPGPAFLIPRNNTPFCYTPTLAQQKIRDNLTGANITIMTYTKTTAFVNITSLGALPQFIQTGVGGQVCFANNDDIAHNISFKSTESCDHWPKPGPSTLALPQKVIAPGDIGCYATPREGAYAFEEASLRSDPDTGNITTQTNITVLSDYPGNFTFYILKEPPENGSIQPNSQFILTNDTIEWVNCRNEDFGISVKKSISPVWGSSPPSPVPALGVMDWKDFSVGSTEVFAQGLSTQHDLLARLFIADKNSFTATQNYIYTGPATKNNLSMHLAVQWQPGDIGAYTLLFTRTVLSSKALTAFPTNLNNRVLFSIFPKSALTSTPASIPAGSRVTWMNVDTIPHTVANNWGAAPNPRTLGSGGTIVYNNIPARTLPYTVSEGSLSYSVNVYSSNLVIRMTMANYSYTGGPPPAPLITNLGKTVCFENRGAALRTLRITGPPGAYTIINPSGGPAPNTAPALAEGSYLVHTYNPVSGAVGCTHTLNIENAASSTPPFGPTCTDGTYGLTPGTSFWFASPSASTTLEYSLLSEPSPCDGTTCCRDRNITIDGTLYQLPNGGAPQPWTPSLPSHTFTLFYTDNTNSTTDSKTYHFGIPVDFSASPSVVVTRQGDTVSWSNPASCGAGFTQIAIETPVVMPEELTIYPGRTECYVPDATTPRLYNVQDITSPTLGNMTIDARAPLSSGTDTVLLSFFSSSVPPLIETTPLSQICWHSDDGNKYSLETMQGPKTVPVVPPHAPPNPNDYCWGPPPPGSSIPAGTWKINETNSGFTWTITSGAGTYLIPMFLDSNVFNPPTGITRTDTYACFRNNDTPGRWVALCRLLPNVTVPAGGPTCEIFCEPEFPIINRVGAASATNRSVICGTYTFDIPKPAPTSAFLTALMTSSATNIGYVDLNGARLCTGPCSIWVPINRLRVFPPTNTLTICGYANLLYGTTYGNPWYQFSITVNRVYPTNWKVLLGPGETKCMPDQLNTAINPGYTGNCYAAPRPPFTSPYNFSDSVTKDNMTINVTGICDAAEVTKIARKLNRYDAAIFQRPEFEIFPAYNQHGPAWPSIVTSEVGLGAGQAPCICAQLKNITAECPNCTAALAVDYSDLGTAKQFVDSVFANPACNKADTKAIALFVDGNALAASLHVCPGAYPGCDCNYSKIWDDFAQFSKYVVYKYQKPTVVLSFKMTDMPGTCYDAPSLTRMYKELYSSSLTHMSGAGIFGLSYTCLNEDTLNGDCFINRNPTGMGLMTSYGPPAVSRQQADGWFQSCGRYYYNSEGITMTTYSANETNSTACDASRLMDLYQQYKCYAD